MFSAILFRSVRNLAAFAVSLLVLVAGTAAAQGVRHDTTFKSVPGSKLQIRAVEYDGHTNGTLKVQIKNTQKEKLKFTASGLYFVPEGDPDKAPQRLGAVGPIQLGSGDKAKEVTELDVAAGETVEVTLDVFCIDSHRSSPSPQNSFGVGKSRMPKQLASTIEKSADVAVQAETAKGTPAPRKAAKSAIQSEVWKSRNDKWMKLDGEGKQEAGKR
jgi:hypothetical protein